MSKQQTINGIFLIEGVDSVGVDLETLAIGRIELVQSISEFAEIITAQIKEYEDADADFAGVIEYEVVFPAGVWLAVFIKENIYFPSNDDFKWAAGELLKGFFDNDNEATL